MTGSLVVDLLISLAGIFVLVGVSYAFGGWRDAAVSEAEAAERLAFDEPDFSPGEWIVGADGKTAVALSADGREIAIVFAVGDGVASRRFSRDAVAWETRADGLLLRLNEPSRGGVTLAAPDSETAARWRSRLAGAPL